MSVALARLDGGCTVPAGHPGGTPQPHRAPCVAPNNHNRAAARFAMGTQAHGCYRAPEHQCCRLGQAFSSWQQGREQQAVLPSGFWQALPQAAGQHLRVLSQSPSDWHPTVQFTASIAGSGHTPAFAARQRRRVWAGAGAAGPLAQGKGCQLQAGDAATSPRAGSGDAA